MQKKYIYLIGFLVFGLCFFACRKDPKNPSWDVDILAPLIKSTLTINNIITDSILHQNPDNSLDIVYKYALPAFSVDSLFKIPDTTLKNKYVAPFSATIAPGATIVSQTQNINFVSGGVSLTNVTIRSGYMLFSIKSSIKEVTHLTYILPKVTDPVSGSVFNKTFIIPKGTVSSPGVYSGSFDLSGYKIDLRGTNGTSVNTMIISYTAILDPLAPASVNIAPGDSVVISNSFKDIVPQYAKGYFGHPITSIGPDTSDFPLFKHFINGTLKLEDIDIGLKIQNEIGADARITIDNLSAINTRTANAVPLNGSVIGVPLNINRSVDNSGMVTPSTYSVSFTPSNSNILAFMENLPDKLSYQLSLEINPLGNVSGGNDFIYYDKLMKTEMVMTIPLSFVANDLTLADTIDFNMPSTIDKVNGGNLYLYAENGFPFSADPQIYLMDGNFHIVDSLISAPNSIMAPPLDANLICIGKKATKLTFPITEQKLSKLRATDKMYITMKFNTSDQPKYVKIYSFYEMNIKLVGDFNYTVGKK